MFDRFAICAAHQALENDWNRGGWLHERPSNQRRRESTGCQLARLGFSNPGGGTFSALEDEEKFIYCDALARFGLGPEVRADDDIAEFVRAQFVPEFVAEFFPQLGACHG